MCTKGLLTSGSCFDAYPFDNQPIKLAGLTYVQVRSDVAGCEAQAPGYVEWAAMLTRWRAFDPRKRTIAAMRCHMPKRTRAVRYCKSERECVTEEAAAYQCRDVYPSYVGQVSSFEWSPGEPDRVQIYESAGCKGPGQILEPGAAEKMKWGGQTVKSYQIVRRCHHAGSPNFEWWC